MLVIKRFLLVLQEGFGQFGLVDDTFTEAQLHPLVTSQAVAFTRANNTLPSGLVATGDSMKLAAQEVC